MLLSGQAPGAARMRPSPIRGERRWPSWAAPVHEPRRTFISSAPPTGGLSCQAGLASALQRTHGQQRTVSIVGRWGRCRACIDGAFGRTARELCSARAVRLDPCSSSDVLTRLPSQSRGKRNVGLLEVGFLCCIPNAQALSIALRPSHFMRGANRKATLASHDSLASSCDVVVRERQSEFSDAADAAGMRPSSAPICPVRRSLKTTVALTLNPSVPPRAGRAHATPTSMRNATWLILRVVICLSQRLSHACGSADVAFRTPPAPYEKSKFLGSGGSMVARLKLKGIDGRAPPGVEPAA
ncbi:hypothetical protein BC332_33783 [Capsicum chinense]|nr:hypothetical protein BC332_33783 [Capsicum chinense]